MFFGIESGVQELLDAFIDQAPGPLPRPADIRTVSPEEAQFTGVVFKIQANMDPKHRDRCAFLRICSGEFQEGMTVFHVRHDREFKITNAIRFLSQERTNIDLAYAGDIIGIRDRRTLMIGDTITQGEKLHFSGIPQFSPDIFCRVELRNPIKNKQLQKGLEQMAEEGTSQIFRRKHNSETIIGVVGELQLEVVKFRLLHEYGAEAVFIPLPFTASRWFHVADKPAAEKFFGYHHSAIVYDVRGYPMMLFKGDWEREYIEKENPKVTFCSSLLHYLGNLNG